MNAIGLAITSKCVTAAKVSSLMGRVRLKAVHREPIDWKPYSPLPVNQILEVLGSIQQKMKLNSNDVALCIPNYCFSCHCLDLSANKSKNFRKSELDYIFEEYLPLDLERIVTQYSRIDHRNNVYLAGGLIVSTVKSLLARLQETGIKVTYLSGDLFYFGGWIGRTLGKHKHSTIVLSAGAESVGVVLIQQREVILARYLSAGHKSLIKGGATGTEDRLSDACVHQLDLTLAAAGVNKADARLVLLGEEPYRALWQEKLSSSGDVQENPVNTLGMDAVFSKKLTNKLHDFAEISAFAAAAALLRPSGACLNFRHGELSAGTVLKKLRRPAAAIIILIISLLLVVCYRVHRQGLAWQRQGYLYRQQQKEIWQKIFPQTPVPADIVGRLVSEQKRLEGLAGQASGLPRYRPALDTLKNLIANLPDNVDVRIDEIKITQDTAVIVGQTKSFSDVETLSTSLQRTRKFKMQPAQSKRLTEHIVGFTLTGRMGKGGYDFDLSPEELGIP